MTSNSDAGEITALIQQWRGGRQAAAEQLIGKVYPELKRIAAAYLNNERHNHTLAPTALVNELYLKFLASCPTAARDRAHFFALAAQSLRHILVDHARLHRAKKRGGTSLRITLSAKSLGHEASNEDVLSVHEALTQLQELDSRAAQVVELRFFGGLKEEEVAEVLGVSKNTVQRDWRMARAWLMSRLKTDDAPRRKKQP